MSSNNHGSTKVIVTALIANLGISGAKFIGAIISGSASLLAEAIHSLVDSTNQVLLLIGSKKAVKPPDDVHPLGYGREAFFWSFIVAILLFSLGGLFAIYEGTHKLSEQSTIGTPALGLSILLFSVILEGYSFWACYKEVKIQKKSMSLWQWFKNTKSTELLVIFTEDLAALLGLLIATICLTLAWITGNPQWDAIGSLLVGIILVIVAILLAIEIKSFIIGESPSHEIRDYVYQEVPKIFSDGRVLRWIAVQTGSNEIMLSYKIHPGNISQSLQSGIERVNELEKKTKLQFPMVKWQFVELDTEA